MFYNSTGSLRPKAIYPLNRITKGREITRNRNKPGKLGVVRPVKGPDGKRGSAYKFFGRPNSFIELPNAGPIDTKYSITILAWIYPENKAGPIFHYNPSGWGVHFWVVNRGTIFARFTSRKSLASTPAVYYPLPKLFKWYFVGTTYDYKTGVAKLFVNYRLVAKKRIGRIKLATNYPVRIGVKKGDARYFKGRVSCVQVYNMALSSRQMINRRRKCFSRTGLF